MAIGIIIHITVGSEKRTEFFSQERIRIGSDDTSDLQIHTAARDDDDMWFDLENADGVYRITDYNEKLGLKINGKPLRRFIAIGDSDVIDVADSEISFAFFSLESKSSLITTTASSRTFRVSSRTRHSNQLPRPNGTMPRRFFANLFGN
jgi:hypothetical protein